MKKSRKDLFIIFFLITALLFLVRFSSGFTYKPVMDDWFLYGDIYDNKWDFIISNEKFAIRPLAGAIDIFIAAPLFDRLWVVEILMSFCQAFGAVFFADIFRKNDFQADGLFIIALCLIPMNMEATYWLAASIRISCAMLFTALPVWFLNEFLISDKRKYAAAYSVAGFAAVSFYEPAVVIYFLLSCYLVLRKRNKKYLRLLIPLAAHLIYIALYYILNGSGGEMAVRGHLLANNFFEHAAEVTDMIARVLTVYNIRAFSLGLKDGISLIISEGLYLQTAAVAALSFLLGFMLRRNETENRRFSPRRLMLCLILSLGGVSLFYIIGGLFIAIRFVYFSFIGIGLAAEELMLIMPKNGRRIINFFLVPALSCCFAVSGMGTVSQYQKTSAEDERIVSQILSADTENFVTNPDRNTYLLGAAPYYKSVKSVEWLESIRGACSGYADLTGCMRHKAGKVNTNNLTPVPDYGAIKMSYYINSPEICRFFALDDNLNVITVHLRQENDRFKVLEESGRVYGEIIRDENGTYRFYQTVFG